MTCRILNVEFVFQKNDEALAIIKKLYGSEKDFYLMMKNTFDYIVLRDNDMLFSILNDLILEMEDKSRNNEDVKQLLFAQLFIKVSRLWKEKYQKINISGTVHVRRAIEYIHKHYDSDIKTEDIAKELNINVSYLQKLFKTHNDCTIIQYLTRLRMEKAKMLLKNTDIPIIDIAGYVGVNSRQYFTHMFHKFWGESPDAYRKRCETPRYTS